MYFIATGMLVPETIMKDPLKIVPNPPPPATAPASTKSLRFGIPSVTPGIVLFGGAEWATRANTKETERSGARQYAYQRQGLVRWETGIDENARTYHSGSADPVIVVRNYLSHVLMLVFAGKADIDVLQQTSTCSLILVHAKPIYSSGFLKSSQLYKTE